RRSAKSQHGNLLGRVSDTREVGQTRYSLQPCQYRRGRISKAARILRDGRGSKDGYKLQQRRRHFGSHFVLQFSVANRSHPPWRESVTRKRRAFEPCRELKRAKLQLFIGSAVREKKRSISIILGLINL